MTSSLHQADLDRSGSRASLDRAREHALAWLDSLPDRRVVETTDEDVARSVEARHRAGSA